jgi:hypothetical protein
METYRHSGAVPIGGAIASIVLGLLAALIGGFAYAYAFYWIPFIYLNFLMTLIFAAIIGGGVYVGGHVGKVRNTTFSMVVGFLCALFGLWVYWGAYAWALVGPQVGLAAWSPFGLIAFAQALFENGSWGLMGDNPVTGWFLVVAWLIEAGVILFVAVAAAAIDSDTAYCERCQQWTDMQKGVASLDASGAEQTWSRITAGDLVGLAEFQPAPAGSLKFVRLDLAICPQCQTSHFLTIKRVEITHDKKGNAKENEQALVTNAILGPQHVEIVKLCGALARGELPGEIRPTGETGAASDTTDAGHA